MDFGLFGFSPEQVEELRRSMVARQMQAHGASQPATAATGSGNGLDQQQQQASAGTGNNSGDSGDAQQGPVFMHNALHAGVVCDICDTEIRGFRYKCAQCSDFDLCSKCEHKGHHAGHIMLRISFPEQARDAARKFLNNANNSCPPSPPTPPRHGHGHGPHHHGHGPHHGPHRGPGLEDHPLFAGRRGHCHRRSQGHGEDAERPSTAPAGGPGSPGCPYGLGKKEFKKWSKWMKRAAAHQHRSAEAYARAAATGGGAAAGASGSDGEAEPQMDFAAVASQIQEFLNYWGVPVDVVELYDQFGNRGQNRSTDNQSQGTQAAGNSGTEQNQQNTAGTAEGNNTATTAAAADANASVSQDQQPASPAAATATLSENMQQMKINESQNNNAAVRDESLLMDLDAENSGWTILNDSREGSVPDGRQQNEATVPTAPLDQTSSGPSSTASMDSNPAKDNPSPPFASAAGSNVSSTNGQSAPQPTAPAYPTGLPNVPLYPVLNPPQIQQILKGVSTAVNSVVRSIPIVTDPRGPMATNVTNTGGQVPATTTTTGAPAATAPASDVPELNARSIKTLNQLLAMGFSNEGGYLTRLVVAKNGDLEAVLSSLFPN